VSPDLVLLDRERMNVCLLDLAEHAGLHRSSKLGEWYHSLLPEEPAVVATSNAAKTTAKSYVVLSTVFPVLGFAIPSSSRLA